MDDDEKKSAEEAAEPARDATQDEGAKLREVSEEEIEQILAAHETWFKRIMVFSVMLYPLVKRSSKVRQTIPPIMHPCGGPS